MNLEKEYLLRGRSAISGRTDRIAENINKVLELINFQNNAINDQLLNVMEDEKQIYQDLVEKKSSYTNNSQYQRNSQLSSTSKKEANKGSSPSSTFNYNDILQWVRRTGFKDERQKVQLISLFNSITQNHASQVLQLKKQVLILLQALNNEVKNGNYQKSKMNQISTQILQLQFQNPQIGYREPPRQDSQQKTPLDQHTSFTLRKQKVHNQEFAYHDSNVNNFKKGTQQTDLKPQSTIDKLNQLQASGVYNQMRRYNQELKKWRLQSFQKINQDKIHGSQLQSLLQQGQLIRKQSIQLLQLRLSDEIRHFQDRENSLLNRVNSLQTKLQKEERAKQNFLVDLKQFKDRFKELQAQNARLKAVQL